MSEYITLKVGGELRPTDEQRNLRYVNFGMHEWHNAPAQSVISEQDIRNGWEFRRRVETPAEADAAASEAITALIRSGFSPAALTAALAAYEGGSK